MKHGLFEYVSVSFFIPRPAFMFASVLFTMPSLAGPFKLGTENCDFFKGRDE